MPPATTTDLRHWRWTFVLTFLTVTVLTHLPRTDVGDPAHAPPDKLIHFLAFGTLALLLVRSRWMPWPAAIVGMLAWVPFDEWTQHLISPSRMFEWYDITCGWLGVASVGVLADALRPPLTARGIAGHKQLSRTFDALTATARGGLLPVLTGATVFFALAVSLYIVVWMTTKRSEAEPATILALAAGGGTTLGMMQARWVGPALPRVHPALSLAALAALLIAVAVGRASGAPTLQATGAAWGLLAVAVIIGHGGRPAFCRACEHAGSDPD